MADPPEKKVLKKTPDGDGIDRLSALSDCVLLHILSLLETKEAAATSILSRRWRNLFVSLPDVDLCFCVDNDASDRDRLFYQFIHFANRVIEQRNKASIRKIRLHVMDFVKSYCLAFQSLLISAAAAISTYNVQQLRISVPMDTTTERFSIPIPPGIFSSETLVSLSLNLEALYFSQQVLPTFRNLIKLELIPVYCHSFPRSWILHVLSNLFESSPNLEVLIFSEVFKNYFGEDEEIDSVFPWALPLTFIEHLEVIEMSNFKGEEHEFKLVEYFLKNGKSLKKIALEREGWKSVPEYRDQMLSFKKCSEDCQIVFRKKWDYITCPQLRQEMNLSP